VLKPTVHRVVHIYIKVKVKFALEEAMKAQRGSILPLTSALDGVGG
jgi:hypothetical protein